MCSPRLTLEKAGHGKSPSGLGNVTSGTENGAIYVRVPSDGSGVTVLERTGSICHRPPAAGAARVEYSVS